MHIDFPFRLDRHGALAGTGRDDHVRDMLEQLLLTAPGERVNRPEFGCNLLHQVFEPNAPELAEVIEFTVKAAIQRWLGDVIEPHAVEISAHETTLEVTVAYVIRRNGERKTERFLWEAK